MREIDEHLLGRLRARPTGSVPMPLESGLHPFGGSDGREHLLLVPAAETAAGEPLPAAPDDRSAPHGHPLLVILHGSGSEPVRTLRLVERQAATAGVAVLLPKSARYTWDAVLGGFGPDVAELDALLAATFGLLPVDPRRIAVAGFSDGASYALSIGLVNGDLFRTVVAFSPGFIVPGPLAGTPKIFIFHGVSDAVLPIERCSRLLVPALRGEGRTVDYREFDGGHVVPPELAAEAIGRISHAPIPD